MSRVLITGNLGYIGPVLQRVFRESAPDVALVGYDSGFFAHGLSTNVRSPDVGLERQWYGDVRDVPDAALEGVDTVIHLAAISNDPMGSSYEAVTDEINHRASVALAAQAKRAGVSRFVFASSCSMYGFAEGGARGEGDALNPLTAYARSKVATEEGLRELAGPGFGVTCLRFATACGMSERIRLDLVLNDFVAGAIASGRVDILSDGSPWRPIIAIEDMSAAMLWAHCRDAANGGEFLAVNTGSDDWNFQVRELANAVAETIPGTEVTVNHNAPPDKRSYRVSFARFAELAPGWKPRRGLGEVIGEIAEGLRAIGFADERFREGPFIRLHTLDRHRRSGLLDETLRWRKE